jgi:hypothetical protein
MATESLPNDSSNTLDDARALSDSALNTAGILAQKGITRGVRGLVSGVRDVLNPSRDEVQEQVKQIQRRQQLVNQGFRVANQGVQSLLYTVGGVPGFIYKGLRVVAGEEGALYLLFGLVAVCFLGLLLMINLGVEVVNNPGEILRLGIECKLSGKSDADCAAQKLATKASELAKQDTCGTIAERTGKGNINCDNLGVQD